MGRVDQRDGHEPETGEVKSQGEWREEERLAVEWLGRCRPGSVESRDAWAAVSRAIRGQEEARVRALREVRWAEPLTVEEQLRREEFGAGGCGVPDEPTVTEEVLREARCLEEAREPVEWCHPNERKVVDEPLPVGRVELPPPTTEEYVRSLWPKSNAETRKRAVVDAAKLTTEQRAMIVLRCGEAVDVQYGFAREALLKMVVSALERDELEARSLTLTVGVEDAARRVLKDAA